VKQTLLVLVIFASSTAFSQSPFKIEQNFMADFALFPERVAVNNNVYEGLSAGYALNPRLAYFGTGITAEYKVASKIFLRTGFGYLYRKMNGYQIDDPTGNSTWFGLRHFDLSQGIRHYFSTRRLTLYADGGLTGSWLYKNKAYHVMGKENRTYIDPLPAAKFPLSAYLGVGAGTSTPIIQLNVAIVYKNGITPYIEGSDYRMKSIGVNIGIAVKIGGRRTSE
jgi:hypothetical protein